MVFYFYLSECLHPQFRSSLWFTGSFTMAYVHSSLILRCIKMTSQSSVNLGCASCLLQCTQTSGQLNYKTEQYISNVYLLPIRLKVRTISWGFSLLKRENAAWTEMRLERYLLHLYYVLDGFDKQFHTWNSFKWLT